MRKLLQVTNGPMVAVVVVSAMALSSVKASQTPRDSPSSMTTEPALRKIRWSATQSVSMPTPSAACAMSRSSLQPIARFDPSRISPWRSSTPNSSLSVGVSVAFAIVCVLHIVRPPTVGPRARAKCSGSVEAAPLKSLGCRTESGSGAGQGAVRAPPTVKPRN